jgi:hypothetical protein
MMDYIDCSQMALLVAWETVDQIVGFEINQKMGEQALEEE